MGKLLIALLLWTAVLAPTAAFIAPKVHSSTQSPLRTNNVASSKTSLSLSSSPGDGKNNDSFPKARTDIRIFLTQRSIQSFVYLLNQCREDHTVRWLEKTLDFTSIDNFHGTGAFNQTKFPEWDSIFLDCVDRPEEVVVLQMRQRRRQQKLSGHNAYFESLKSSAKTSKPKKVVETKSDPSSSPPTTNGFSTMNYLDAMTTAKSSPSAAAATRKKSWDPKTTNRKLSGAGNYLDNISSSPSAASEKKEPESTEMKDSEKKIYSKDEEEKNHKVVCDKDNSTGDEENKNEDEKVIFDAKISKDDEKKKEQKVVCDAKHSKGEGKDSLQKNETPIVKRRAFASSNYLENLSTISNVTSTRRTKVEQSTETSRNPYLEEKTKEYELSIDPPALVRRILSVRELISKEWVEDLEMLLALNDDIAESFDEYNTNSKAKNDDDDDDGEEDQAKIDNVRRKADDGEKRASDFDAFLKSLNATKAQKDSQPNVSSMSLNESLKDETKQALPGDEKRQKVFDRTILSTWSQSLWSPKRSSSPYRKANFDLLLLLATQESIHRVLNSYKKDDFVRPHTHEWLLDFYTDNVNEYFDGHQTYARSEDFLEEMSKSPRTLIETNNDILAWTDPAIVAEDIVRERSEVILDWMKVAKNILEEHTDLRRLLFTNMVSKSFPDEALSDTILTAVKNETEEDSTHSPSEVFGAFE